MFLKGVIDINNNEFDDNMSLILDYSLEFENYMDDTGEKPKLLLDLYKKIDDLRTNKDKLDDEIKINKTREILDGFKELINIVGKDKFEFNDDGSFFYIWTYPNKKGNNKNE